MRKAYQTLENKEVHKIEDNGPFLCKRQQAWLGNGYYYWESFIENAHWWGLEGARYQNGYVICESSFELDEDKCFNLVDNPEHLKMFNSTKELLIEKGLYLQGKTTVARIIEFIKKIIGAFKYEAIRVYGVNSLNSSSQYSNRTIFVYKNGISSYQYLDSRPAIQICFYSKSSLNLTGYKIVYPPEYSEDYLV